MRKKHSHIGLIVSLALHAILLGGGFFWLKEHQQEKMAEQNVLSMEMVAALLEQPQVATAPETLEEVKEEVKEAEEEKIAPEPEPEAIPDPTLKPKEEPKKEKPKKQEKRKESPKKKPKPIKALERAPEAQKGIVAKAIPSEVQGEKEVNGAVGGQKNGSLNSTSTTANNRANGGNASEISAYKVLLQRALQRRANNSYPQREKMMRRTGTVTIKFNISPSGSVSNVSIVNSSGNSNLDAAAVKSAEGLSVSAPPAGFPSNITVPIKFEIQ